MNSTDTNPDKASHEIIACPICGGSFECKMGTITECQCMEVVLRPEQILKLKEKFNGCLCKNCLVTIQKKL